MASGGAARPCSALLRDELLALSGDVGGRRLIQSDHTWIYYPADEAELFDVDTRNDMAVVTIDYPYNDLNYRHTSTYTIHGIS